MATLRSRLDFEALENEMLAPYAMKSQLSRGREHGLAEHEFRSVYQRNLARIIHSKAFRRLEYKTQVFVNHEGDHYRTRLTHSLEVAQIARTAARILRLNEELAEAISLSHDLGHTPFGHSGEHCMAELMREHGGFEHNRQSLRVVTKLEGVYPEFPGLNLTYEVRDGISKHFTEYDNKGLKTDGHFTLEAELVNIADEIAYNNHDLDDGLRSGMISLGQLEEIDLWQENYLEAQRKHPDQDKLVWRTQTVRRLINLLVMDLVETTQKNLQDMNIKSHEDFVGCSEKLVGFSEKIRRRNSQLKKFLYENLYQHYRVVRMAEKAHKIIKELFGAYVHNIHVLPPQVHQAIESEGLYRAVCDYIAGMTDRFALEEYHKLFNPHERV